MGSGAFSRCQKNYWSFGLHRHETNLLLPRSRPYEAHNFRTRILLSFWPLRLQAANSELKLVEKWRTGVYLQSRWHENRHRGSQAETEGVKATGLGTEQGGISEAQKATRRTENSSNGRQQKFESIGHLKTQVIRQRADSRWSWGQWWWWPDRGLLWRWCCSRRQGKDEKQLGPWKRPRLQLNPSWRLFEVIIEQQSAQGNPFAVRIIAKLIHVYCQQDEF